jgi:23S rRNA maturation mini-RNase III
MWRSALISAIFKECQAGNYRPVSLTYVACKVLESLVREHIIEFMKRNNFFTKNSMDSYLDDLQPFSF